MDRMENKAAASAALGAEDAGIGLTAALKAQRASADRLSVGHTVPTLPEGVTLRDDPMTKTNAFLSKMPKLN